MDLSPQTAGRARKRHGLRSLAADTRRLPFADQSLDLVLSNSTLDHLASLEEVERALVELLRVLKPGGELLLTLDNLANPAVALRNALPYGLLHRMRLVPYRMGATCGPRRLARMLRDAGFEVREQRTLMHCPRVLVVLLAGLIDRCASERVRLALMRSLLKCERLDSLPTRHLTGYFIAARAVRPAR
jgi:ubiquinone/menaquinone biosynthesis C-methylase UbiE